MACHAQIDVARYIADVLHVNYSIIGRSHEHSLRV